MVRAVFCAKRNNDLAQVMQQENLHNARNAERALCGCLKKAGGLPLLFFRFLELESSGQRSEVRLHYRTKGQTAHTEVFPYSLADDQWHKVSVAVSASHVILHVDCNR